MFYIGWIVLTATGILTSLWVFSWALRTGQFSDQGRARYLPLTGETFEDRGVNSSRLPIEVYVLLGVFGIGMVAMASTIVFSFFRWRG